MQDASDDDFVGKVEQKDDDSVLFRVEVYLTDTVTTPLLMSISDLTRWNEHRMLRDHAWRATMINSKLIVEFSRSTSARELCDHTAQEKADKELSSKIAWAFA